MTVRTERTNLFPLGNDEYLTEKQFEQLPYRSSWDTDSTLTNIARVQIEHNGLSSNLTTWRVLSHDTDGNLVRRGVTEPSMQRETILRDGEWQIVALNGSQVYADLRQHGWGASTDQWRVDLKCGDGDTINASLTNWNSKRNAGQMLALTETGRVRIEAQHATDLANYKRASELWDDVQALPQILFWQPRPKQIKINL